MIGILKEVMKHIPDNAKISNSGFEGANIVLYTKSRDFFLNNNGVIKEVVDNVKKRVELRADPSMCHGIENSEEIIKKLVPKEAGPLEITFDPQRSMVIIEAEKPGIAIGKGGEVLKKIKKETMWVPLVKRTPPIRSKIIEKIREVLYENNDYRKKFLNEVGDHIYGNWTKERKEGWVRITFLGAARQVGRSCFLIQTPLSKILLDCGVDVSAQEKDMYPIFDVPEFNLKELDAIVITHPHADHAALIPYLYKMGFRGPTYCTLPTRDIAALLNLDFINVAQKEGKTPLYGSRDIKEMVKHCIWLNYDEVTDISPDIRLTFYDAGHTLGSSVVHLNIGNGLHNLVYSGDFNYETSNLLSPSNTKFPRLETLMMEATYGGKEDIQPTRKECEDLLLNLITKTIERKGKVLLPVLGTGRSQEIMVMVERAIREGKIKKIPVYVQGIVWDITAIHTAYPDFFNSSMKKLIFHRDKNPFISDIFKQIGSQKEMKEVIEGGPCIILATSGMMVGGASVEYFKHLADNKKNTIIFTSYLGPNSLARKIAEGEKEIRFNSKELIKVEMEIHQIRGFTGHSTRDQLINFVKHLNPRPKKIIIVHGENSKCLDLASSLHKMFRLETIAPKNLDTVRIR